MKTIYDIDLESMGPIGGFNSGEQLVVAYAARRPGKSMLNQWYGQLGETIMTKGNFEITDQAPVDGDTWYTVACVSCVSDWMREQPKEWWHEHIDLRWIHYSNKFDIHEKLYTILALRWS
jgi:hypothetical protein